jgi:hypothetical protein
MNDPKSFEDIVRALSADLEAATDALITPVLNPKHAPKKSRGIEAVRQQIASAFEVVHNSLAAELRTLPKPSAKTQRPVNGTVKAAPKPRRPLSETAAPILRVAEARFENTVVRHPHHQGAYLVVAPKENINELFDQALACLPDAPESEAKLEIIEEEEAVEPPNQMHKIAKGGQ